MTDIRISNATQFFIVLLLAAGSAVAQQPSAPSSFGPGPMQGSFKHGLHVPPGKWWDNPGIAQQLNLTSDQQKKMDAIFEQNRAKLSQLHEALQQEEQSMKALFDAEHPDPSQIDAQIDRSAQARAELEKAHSRMLLSIRALMTQDQWEKLRALQPPPGSPFMHRPGSGSDHGNLPSPQ